MKSAGWRRETHQGGRLRYRSPTRSPLALYLGKRHFRVRAVTNFAVLKNLKKRICREKRATAMGQQDHPKPGQFLEVALQGGFTR